MRVAGCATPASSASHASAGAKVNDKLTFHPDHSVGVDQLEEAEAVHELVERGEVIGRAALRING